MDDGPCLALSEFMDKNKNIPPDFWDGYRNIDQKEAVPSLSFAKPADDDLEDEEEDDDSLS